MANHHLQLVSDAKATIDKVFADTSVSKDTTRASLEDIKDDLEAKLRSLEDE